MWPFSLWQCLGNLLQTTGQLLKINMYPQIVEGKMCNATLMEKLLYLKDLSIPWLINMHLLPAIIFLIFFIRIKNSYKVSFISKLQIFGSYNYFAGRANYCLWGLCNWCGSGGCHCFYFKYFLLTVISHILQRSCQKITHF